MSGSGFAHSLDSGCITCSGRELHFSARWAQVGPMSSKLETDSSSSRRQRRCSSQVNLVVSYKSSVNQLQREVAKLEALIRQPDSPSTTSSTAEALLTSGALMQVEGRGADPRGKSVTFAARLALSKMVNRAHPVSSPEHSWISRMDSLVSCVGARVRKSEHFQDKLGEDVSVLFQLCIRKSRAHVLPKLVLTMILPEQLKTRIEERMTRPLNSCWKRPVTRLH